MFSPAPILPTEITALVRTGSGHMPAAGAPVPGASEAFLAVAIRSGLILPGSGFQSVLTSATGSGLPPGGRSLPGAGSALPLAGARLSGAVSEAPAPPAAQAATIEVRIALAGLNPDNPAVAVALASAAEDGVTLAVAPPEVQAGGSGQPGLLDISILQYVDADVSVSVELPGSARVPVEVGVIAGPEMALIEEQILTGRRGLSVTSMTAMAGAAGAEIESQADLPDAPGYTVLEPRGRSTGTPVLIPVQSEAAVVFVDERPTAGDKPRPVTEQVQIEGMAARTPLERTASVEPRLQASATVPAQLTDPNWSEQFASRVQWFLSEGVSNARVTLNPPELGRIDIRIGVQNDQTNMQMVVHHAAVRDAVEDALPRLREMLAQSGLALGDTHVTTSHEQRQGSTAYSPAHAHGDDVVMLEDSRAESVAEAMHVEIRHGLVDMFV